MASFSGRHAAPVRGPSSPASGGRVRQHAVHRVLRRSAAPAAALPALVLYALFVLWPLCRLVQISLEHWDGITAPSYAGLDNYSQLFSDPGFAVEVQHTLIWLVVTLVVPLLVGAVAALLLRRTAPRLRPLLRAVLVLPLLLPTVLIAVAWKLLYNPLSGPITSTLQRLGLGAWALDWLGDPTVALPALLVPACWASFGLSMLLCEAALARIDPTIEAAASLDGAGRWSRFVYVTVPALRGALPLAAVVTALCAVPSYDLILLMTNGGPGYATTTLTLDAYGRAFGGIGQVGVGAALACLQALIGVLLAGGALWIARGHVADEQQGDVQWRPAASVRIQAAVTSAAVLLAALTLLPLIWLAVLALSPDAGQSVLSSLLANLAQIGDQGFGGALATSAGLASAVSALTLLLALPAAYYLATLRRRGALLIAALLLAVGLFEPAAVLIIPLFSTLLSFNLLNTAAGIALPEVARALPVAVLLLWLGMRALPRQVLEAAAVDGASHPAVLALVVVPLLQPLLVAVAVWGFVSSWNEYLLPTVVVQDESLQTIPIALAHFVGRFDTEYALLATGALLAVLPLLVLYVALYGTLARGLARVRPASWLR